MWLRSPFPERLEQREEVGLVAPHDAVARRQLVDLDADNAGLVPFARGKMIGVHWRGAHVA